MKRIYEEGARGYLRRHGVLDPGKITEIVGGFDFGRAVYEQLLAPGDELFQFIRKPSVATPSSFAGNWFALVGATTSGLTITDGVGGRRLHKFRVVAGLVALEGTAARKGVNWDWAGGGVGGATQIYIPPSLIGHLQAIGAHEW